MSEALLQRFQREVDRGVLADAYLFLGPSRARLRSLAVSAAARVLDCRGPVEEHTDCFLFDPEQLGVKGLRVEHIALREGDEETSLEAKLRYKPMQGGRRVVILLDADRMTADAQAALLKTAEEPPEGTLFLLTAVEQSSLSAALRSRCRTYRNGSPSAAETVRLAAAKGLDAEAWAVLYEALGRPEAVLDQAADERQELLKLHQAFQAWIAGQAGLEWLRLPEGTLAEQRVRLEREWSAVLGWARAAYAEADPSLALRLDRLIQAFSQALGELRGQVSPGLLVEALSVEVNGLFMR